MTKFTKAIQGYWYDTATWLCRFFCMSFLRIRTYGRENVPKDGAFLLLSNHQSYYDPMLCGIVHKRRVTFMARDSLFANPIWGRILRSVNALPVKRDSADVSVMKAVIKRLKKGECVCMFPEATRSPDGKIKEVKPGFGLLSRRGNAPIVPVVIDGAYESWPRDKKFPGPGTVTVSFGKGFSPDEIKKLGDKEFAKILTEKLRSMQHQIRIKQGKEPYKY